MAFLDLKPSWGVRPAVRMDGTLHPNFVAVANAFERQLRSYQGGAAIAVYHHGECVVDLWGGAKDRNGTPWERDTLAPSFSTTKGVASTLLHVMADRGLLKYDDPVAKYWPEFAQAGKGAITIRHVLAHQSGLYHIRQMIDRADRMLDWEYMVHALERTPPAHKPGERSGYHGLTYGFLVGEILQRLSGKHFSQLVQEEIAQPLRLDGMYVGTPEDVLPRAADLIWPSAGLLGRWVPATPELGDRIEQTAAVLQRFLLMVGFDVDLGSTLNALAPRGIGSFDFGAPAALRVVMPSANGLFTARSLARMYACLAGGGEIDGVRLLSAETLKRATRVQNATSRRSVIPFDLRWRLGYHGIFTTRGVPSAAFGHFGFGGSGAWADPTRNLAVGLIVNGMGTPPFADLRIARLSGAVLLSVQRCCGRRSSARQARLSYGTSRPDPRRPSLVPRNATRPQRAPTAATP